MEIYFFVCLCVIFPLLVIFTKLIEGVVHVGDMILCFFISLVPVLNVFSLLYFMYESANRRKWFDKVLF